MSALPGAETVTVAIVSAQMLGWNRLSSCLDFYAVKAGIVQRLRLTAECGVWRVPLRSTRVGSMAGPASCLAGWPVLGN